MNHILKILIVIAIVVALAVGGYIIFRSVFEQRDIMEVAGEVTGQVTGLGTQAADYVKANIPTIVAAGGAVTAFGGTALHYVQKANDKATEIKTAATSQIDVVKQEVNQLKETAIVKENELTTIKKELEAAKTSILTTDTDLLGQYEKQITNLQGQVQATQDQSSNFVKGLMQAANGALVTAPDGKIYSVLKVPPEVIIK